MRKLNKSTPQKKEKTFENICHLNSWLSTFQVSRPIPGRQFFSFPVTCICFQFDKYKVTKLNRGYKFSLLRLTARVFCFVLTELFSLPAMFPSQCRLFIQLSDIVRWWIHVYWVCKHCAKKKSESLPLRGEFWITWGRKPSSQVL